jgi:hypothetical protein
MIVGRWQYPAKVGQAQDLAALLAAEGDRAEAGFPWRLYASETGKQWIVALEIEFESLAQYEEWYQGWYATPQAKEFSAKLVTMLRAPIVLEFWRRER